MIAVRFVDMTGLHFSHTVRSSHQKTSCLSMRWWPICFVVLFTAMMTTHATAQDNYEIQVYGADTIEPHSTMVELHTNFTAAGSKVAVDGVNPTQHAVHETVEITQGFNSWFETGFYIFTSARNGSGWEWVGDHIRPRVRAPERWHWPVGISVSNEIGYQRRKFAVNTWTWEIRPIIDKKLGPWYLSFNPTFDRALHGPDVSRGFEFSPNAKVSFDINPKVALGMEYYGALGPVDGFDALHNQQQQFFPSIDLNVSPQWEINFGVGVGVTHGTDHIIIKGILGRRFSFHRKSRKILGPDNN
jgi:hypothetical protein